MQGPGEIETQSKNLLLVENFDSALELLHKIFHFFPGPPNQGLWSTGTFFFVGEGYRDP